MKRLLLSTILLLTLLPGFAQRPDALIRFQQHKPREAYGFRDGRGAVVIPPDLYRVIADTFHNIIAVQDSSFDGYYLLRDGRKIGRDSLYIFDFETDCESEGFIRFQIRATRKEGFFDSMGRVAIPAVYDYTEPFFNGYAIAYRNGHLECASRDTVNCEHQYWTGGEKVLINTRNEILATGLSSLPETINWYSAAVNLPAPDTAIYFTLSGTTGTRYSFIDYQKEFRQWLNRRFLPALRAGDTGFGELLFTEQIHWSKRKGWQKLSRRAFLKKYPVPVLQSLLSDDAMTRSMVFDEPLTGSLFDGPAFRQYYTSCSRGFQEKYPGFELVIDYAKTGAELPGQDRFTFLRTEAGYKLIGLTLTD